MNGTQERSELLGHYLLDTSCTVRTAAKAFGISKSTVHKDVAVKLKYKNPRLYGEVRELLEKNKSERHLRGGEATRRKYRRDIDEASSDT